MKKKQASMITQFLILLALLLAFSGCRTYTPLSAGSRSQIDKDFDSKVLWLKSSMYAGEFYDDDRFLLLDPRRFEELTDLRNAEGEPMPPAAAEGIIPAGTPVRIEKIDWPVAQTVMLRPIYTPRYSTWIWLRVAKDRSGLLESRPQKFIVVFPAGIPKEEEFRAWADLYFSQSDNNPWLDSLDEKFKDAILEKRASLGMDTKMLHAALGYPDRIRRDPGKNGHQTLEVAVYGALSVVLKDGIVTDVSNPYKSN